MAATQERMYCAPIQSDPGPVPPFSRAKRLQALLTAWMVPSGPHHRHVRVGRVEDALYEVELRDALLLGALAVGDVAKEGEDHATVALEPAAADLDVPQRAVLAGGVASRSGRRRTRAGVTMCRSISSAD
jgi:hypothetical protein